MDKIDTLEEMKFIFGSLFLLPNKLQTLMDQELSSDDITTKQWFLSAIIEHFGDTAPTLSEVSKAMGTSHQNVKQIALKLEKKGFLNMEKDATDRRVIRLKLTEKSNLFWEKRKEGAEEFLIHVFKDLKEDEINVIYKGFNKIYRNIEELE